eukprot:c14012_g2_i1 orf=263-1111(+)
MAWDPNSSSWDWNADGVIVSSHVSGIDLRKPTVNNWPSDTELCSIKHDGAFSHTSRALCSSEARTGYISQGVHVDVTKHGGLLSNRVVTPAMANINGSLVFDGAPGYSNFVPTGQGKVPIVTTCIGNGGFIGTSDHGNGSLESVVRKGLHENHGSSDCRETQGLKPGTQQSSFAQDKHCAGFKSNGKNLVAPKHPPDKQVERTCKGDRKSVTDEQHSSTAMGSAGSGDSLTGLQLGKRTYSQDVTTPAAAKAIPKSNSVSKKARAGSTATQVPRCQVEGCKL